MGKKHLNVNIIITVLFIIAIILRAIFPIIDSYIINFINYIDLFTLILLVLLFLLWIIPIVYKVLKKKRRPYKSIHLQKLIYSITIAVLLIVKFVFYSDIEIDSFTAVLVMIMLLPYLPISIFEWFSKVKSLDLGFAKIELADSAEKTEIEETAINAGLVQSSPNEKYIFYSIKAEDPKLALAGLRIEIEKTLKEIAKKEDIRFNMGLRLLIKELLLKNKISYEEHKVLSQIIDVLNRAVHNDIKEIELQDSDWIFDIGIKILSSLSEKYGLSTNNT